MYIVQLVFLDPKSERRYFGAESFLVGSKAIPGQDWPVMVLPGEEWPVLAILGEDWSLVSIGYTWRGLASIGYTWRGLASIGSVWRVCSAGCLLHADMVAFPAPPAQSSRCCGLARP